MIKDELNYRANLRFPKRFELEGIDPRTVPVLIVVRAGNQWISRTYQNLSAVPRDTGLMQLVGPMADKQDGQWVLRFENQAAYDSLSN